MSAAMYPKVLDDYKQFSKNYGPVTCLPTRHYLTGPKIAEETQVEIEKGKTLHISTLAKSDLKANAMREVFFEMNGQLRSVYVKDKSAHKTVSHHPKAMKDIKEHVGAPMPGTVVDVRVKVGDKVEKGQPLLVLSAMKMEMVVNAPFNGKVAKIHIKKGMKLEGEDLVMEVEES